MKLRNESMYHGDKLNTEDIWDLIDVIGHNILDI